MKRVLLFIVAVLALVVVSTETAFAQFSKLPLGKYAGYNKENSGVGYLFLNGDHRSVREDEDFILAQKPDGSSWKPLSGRFPSVIRVDGKSVKVQDFLSGSDGKYVGYGRGKVYKTGREGGTIVYNRLNLYPLDAWNKVGTTGTFKCGTDDWGWRWFSITPTGTVRDKDCPEVRGHVDDDTKVVVYGFNTPPGFQSLEGMDCTAYMQFYALSPEEGGAKIEGYVTFLILIPKKN